MVFSPDLEVDGFARISVSAAMLELSAIIIVLD